MLRLAYVVLVLSLLLAISHAGIGHQPITVTSPNVTQWADGAEPQPPPIPLAQPQSLLADGAEPQPPPIPLAQPQSLLADGAEPQPPPIPLAQPQSLLADGAEPQPPPIPLAVPISVYSAMIAA